MLSGDYTMRLLHVVSVLLVSGMLPGALPIAHAKHLYQYTDDKGIVHITDVAPTDNANVKVTTTLARAEAQPLMRLREDGPDTDRTITFINFSGGPVSVEVKFSEAANVVSEPPLPTRLVIKPQGETPGVHIHAADPRLGFHYRFSATYMPGDVHAAVDESARYRLPFPAHDQFTVAQGFGGKFSHHDVQNQYAVDIGMPEGTPVIAARDGVVMTLDNDFYGAGLDMASYGDRANNIRIVHADGSMAVYAHMQMETARVHVGARVQAGETLALSGDTGYSSGPHLHFCIQQNRNMELVSVPFKFADTASGFVPVEGMVLGEP